MEYSKIWIRYRRNGYGAPLLGNSICVIKTNHRHRILLRSSVRWRRVNLLLVYRCKKILRTPKHCWKKLVNSLFPLFFFIRNQKLLKRELTNYVLTFDYYPYLKFEPIYWNFTHFSIESNGQEDTQNKHQIEWKFGNAMFAESGIKIIFLGGATHLLMLLLLQQWKFVRFLWFAWITVNSNLINIIDCA